MDKSELTRFLNPNLSQGGSVIAGSSPENPFTHKLRIILRASTNSSSDLPMGVGRKSIGKGVIGMSCHAMMVTRL